MENVSTYSIFKAWTTFLIVIGQSIVFKHSGCDSAVYVFPVVVRFVFFLFFLTDMWSHVFIGSVQVFVFCGI